MDLETVYHKEICPKGMVIVVEDGYCRGEMVPQSGQVRGCTFDGESLTTIFSSRGCVDNPAKYALNVWDQGDDEQVMRTAQDFEAHRIPSKDSPTFQADLNRHWEEENAELREELEYYKSLHREQSADPRQDPDDRHRQYVRGQEKLHDSRSDAAKITEGIERGTPQAQVPADLASPADDVPPHEQDVGSQKAILTPEQRRETIKAVIRTLDKDNPVHYTKGGMAEIPYLEKETGIDDITAAERNEAQDEVENERAGDPAEQ